MSSEFTRELVLDAPALDRAHAVLFARLATAGALLDGPRAPLEEAIAAFADELLSHLAEEEEVMEASAFPERARHKAAHEMFVADFLQLREELREKGPTPVVAEWIRTRIPEWLRFHIRVNDALLAAHLARSQPQPGQIRQRKGDTRRLS